MILCLQDLIGKKVWGIPATFPEDTHERKWKYAPPRMNGPATKLEPALSSKVKNLVLYFVLLLLPKRKKNGCLRASLIFRGMFATFGCAALTYLRLWIGPRERKIYLTGLGYNSKKFFTWPLWPVWSSSQIVYGKMPGSMQCSPWWTVREYAQVKGLGFWRKAILSLVKTATPYSYKKPLLSCPLALTDNKQLTIRKQKFMQCNLSFRLGIGFSLTHKAMC